jgi:GNAT superfamily N-acetyltransferase
VAVRIRLAKDDDLSAVLSLYAQLSPSDVLPAAEEAGETWKSILTSPMIALYVVEHEGELVATCKLVIVPNLTRNQRAFGLIENVVSAEAHRGRGFGRMVMQAAVDHAWSNGCYKVMLMTGRTDPAVLRFYEACGFQRGKTAFQIRRS